jgi:hypothetical protein
MRHTSTAVLIAFLVAVIATQAIFVRVEGSAAHFSDTVESNTGLLANEAESLESEERQESTEDGDEQNHRHSKSERLAAHFAARSGAEVPSKARRSNLGSIRTRAP